MSEVRVTICDRCNPHGDLRPHTGRGVAYMTAEEAVRAGWEREPGANIEGGDDTHYCIQCLDEEDAAAPSDLAKED